MMADNGVMIQYRQCWTLLVGLTFCFFAVPHLLLSSEPGRTGGQRYDRRTAHLMLVVAELGKGNLAAGS
jgi:hypothetical protein